MATQLFFRAEDEDVEPLNDFVVDVREMVLVLTRFIPRVLEVYFRSLPDGTIRPDPE